MESTASHEGYASDKPVPSEPQGSEEAKASTRVLLTAAEPDVVPLGEDATQTPKRGLRFWMCIVAIMVSSFLMVLDLAGVGTALPVIVADLHGREFEWVGSAYALSATAFLPLSGGMAQVFGRRSVMLFMVFLFAVGSAMCGAAPSLNFLIASRTIQGIGAGGIASLTQIIIADLVPLQERGVFNGLIAIAYCFGTSSAPVIAGALVQHGQWRWFFYMNLPICAATAFLVFTCLDLKVPKGTIKEKLLRLDWTGNFLVIAATTAAVIGLTWGGVKFPWSSAQVLVPLILGIVGFIGFIVYEAKVPEQPLVPFSVMSTRTSVSGYIQGFFMNFTLLGCIYYLPVYFQACKFASPIGSGVDIFGLGFTVMPFGVISGISVAKSGKYRPQLWFSWVVLIVSGGLLISLDADTSRGRYIGYQVLIGLGLGILMTTAFFPVLAPLPVSLNANALAFFMFVRFFSQVWGVTVGGTILQNELQKRLPAEFIQQFPSGTSVAYSIIPLIPSLEEPFRTSVRVAFAESLRVYWEVMTACAVAGLAASLMMKEVPLHTALDEDWGLKEGNEGSRSSSGEAELGGSA
ncbi:hypothetical protein M0805_001877 [Coniferiporia weirii]|nr:hypothetical protein M0805_001877 [Coniferiporia weirii]